MRARMHEHVNVEGRTTSEDIGQNIREIVYPRRSPLEEEETTRGGSDDLSPGKSARGSDIARRDAAPPARAARDAVPVPPALRYAAAFLAVATLLQVRATRREEAGPLDRLAGALLPALGLGRGMEFVAGANRTDACPPDRWVDAAFAGPGPAGGALYSEEHDPRLAVDDRPTIFPRCALTRWVQLEEEHACPEGQEYVTVIQPPNTEPRAEAGKIPNIIHLSSPTNCLPSVTVATLRDLLQNADPPGFTAYVHSTRAMENLLFRREWATFPQMQEGALCGAGKLAAAARRFLDAVEVGSSTAQREGIAEDIASGLTRDLWRLAVLWEYGGVVVDVVALLETLAAGEADAAGEAAVGGLLRAWGRERSGALLYFTEARTRATRVPFTDVLGAAPRHPLLYYGLKVATRIATLDTEVAVYVRGRTTKVPPIEEALKRLHYYWSAVVTGDVLQLPQNHTIHFVDAAAHLPPSLTGPGASWRSVRAALRASGAEGVPAEGNFMSDLKHYAAEQGSVPFGLFSCMELTLDLYSQRTTSKK